MAQADAQRDIFRRTLLTKEQVLVKIPKLHPKYMKLIPKARYVNNAGTRVVIPKHYQHGCLVQPDPLEIVFRHFYGISGEHLGKYVVARVEIITKKVNNKSYLMLNIRHTPAVNKPTSILKFSDNGKGKIFIPRTEVKIYFKPIEVKK